MKRWTKHASVRSARPLDRTDSRWQTDLTPLLWNEIKTRAASFVSDWKDKAKNAREEADAQSFQIEFFNIFGVERKKAAVFESRVKLHEDRSASGYIDLSWKGRILIEMKSPGKNLEAAYEQAKNYALALDKKDFPKAILICDSFPKFTAKTGARPFLPEPVPKLIEFWDGLSHPPAFS